MTTPSALTSLTDALYRHGYGPLASGHGILWPCDVARLHELAAALRARSSWRLAAACEHLAAGLAETDAALALPHRPSRAPHLQAAVVHYDAVVRLTR